MFVILVKGDIKMLFFPIKERSAHYNFKKHLFMSEGLLLSEIFSKKFILTNFFKEDCKLLMTVLQIFNKNFMITTQEL